MTKNHNPWNCQLCTTQEAAEYIGMSTSWLEHDRLSDKPVVKFIRSGRRIRYKKTELDKYIKSLK